MPPNRKEITCPQCGHKIELSDRDLRWLDSIMLHGDIPVSPPFNFGCRSCETVFTYDYKPLISDEKPVPPLQAFYVEQIACDSCRLPVDIIVMSATDTNASERKTWR